MSIDRFGWNYIAYGLAASRPTASADLYGKHYWANDTLALSVCLPSATGVPSWYDRAADGSSSVDDATNNGPTSLLTLTHTTSGVCAAGIAARNTYAAEGLAGTVAAAAIDGGLSDVTGGAEFGFVDVMTRGETALVRAARFGSVALAVNYLRIDPSIAGAALPINAVGTDGNININLVPKGSGIVGVYGSAPEVKALAAGADMALKLSGKGTGVVSLNSLFNVTPTTGAVAMNGTAPKLSTPAAAATLAGVATLTLATIAVAEATIGANDLVIVTPLGDPRAAVPAAGDCYYVTVNAGVGFSITAPQAPAAPCNFAYLIIRRT